MSLVRPSAVGCGADAPWRLLVGAGDSKKPRFFWSQSLTMYKMAWNAAKVYKQGCDHT
jgi:hypothetical protein